MKSGSVKILAVVVILLFGVMYALNTSDRSPPGTEHGPLVPELKARLNDLESVTITDADGRLAIVREGDTWRVSDKSGYPADTGVLRQLLLAIADANKVEQKTANPSLYDRLGVQHPAEDGGDGVLVEGSAPEFSFSLILGDAEQGEYRYARLPSEEQSWLIDQNPDVPDAASGWLVSEIVDIPSADVRSVEIRHADGETIRIHKENAEAGTFTVDDIPAGRELSYPTVVNSIAGALGNLTLEDVAPVGEDGLEAAAEAAFVTFDGLRVDVTTSDIDEQTWITVDASTVPVEEPAEPDGEQSAEGGAVPETEPASAGDEPATGGAGAPAAGTEASDGDEEEAAQQTPAERAAAINARTGGWRYRIAGYKADQLTRRWEDVLKTEDEGEVED